MKPNSTTFASAMLPLYGLAKARAPLVAELLWSKSGTRSLSLSLAALYLETAGVPLAGPGRIEQSYGFRCAQTASTAMLVATLKNGVASY